MNIVSKFTEGSALEDGRTPVVETHELSDGRIFKYDYLRPTNLNAQDIIEERAQVIVATLAAREAARQFVAGTSVPLTKHEFLSRFTSAERIKIRARAKTNDIVLDFMEMLNASGGVFHPLALPGINYLAGLGDITPERAQVIGEAW